MMNNLKKVFFHSFVTNGEDPWSEKSGGDPETPRPPPRRPDTSFGRIPGEHYNIEKEKEDEVDDTENDNNSVTSSKKSSKTNQGSTESESGKSPST
ncbi:hypothetical protein SK128_025761, partial [Halocaridina rubra]